MWAWEGEGFVSVTQTKDEVSVLCAEERIPEGGGGVMKPERGFRGLKVTGPLDFGMVGVLSRLTTALAEAGVPVFSVSTYDTDYLFVPDGKLREAVEALRSAGIKVDG
jgi:hypothetical protein